MGNSGEKLREMFDIPIFLTSKEARRLALLGKLRPNTVVKGNLYLGYTKCTVLPDNLTVEGNLDLSGTTVKLPQNLNVKRILYVNYGTDVPPTTSYSVIRGPNERI